MAARSRYASPSKTGENDFCCSCSLSTTGLIATALFPFLVEHACRARESSLASFVSLVRRFSRSVFRKDADFPKRTIPGLHEGSANAMRVRGNARYYRFDSRKFERERLRAIRV